MKPGDLLVPRVRLSIFTHDSVWRRIIDSDIIEATGAAAVIYEYDPILHDWLYSAYSAIHADACILYVSVSDIDFIHESQPTPVHYLFYSGLSCAIVASVDTLDRLFRVISHS